jgi:acyl-CoA dehydrogenase
MKTPDGPESHGDIREGVRALCREFDSAYWQKVDEERGYPDAFVRALTEAGWLSALIPEEYGGSGLSLTAASVIMEEINRSGGNSGACHGQMYNMGTVLRHGSEQQKRQYLPRIASGELRLQSMSVTEPTAGTDTTKISTVAVKKGDRYVVNGQKVWTSRVQHSELMILLARTTPLAQVKKKSDGMSIFIVDLREAAKRGMTVKPIRNMVNHETNQLFFDNLEVPAENLIGEEGKGFRYILDGLNAERILIAAECIGDGYWFIDHATRYAKERVVFDRPIAKNQGIQFPIARAYVNVQGADLMRYRAAALFDAGQACGAEANMAKLLGADASWEAANVCLQTHGGYGFAAEYDVERKFRETRLYQVAPISTNLILSYVGEHILGMPRSF